MVKSQPYDWRDPNSKVYQDPQRFSEGFTVLPLSGEINLYTSPRVAALLAAQRKHTVADLTHVTYIDSSGLAVFIQALEKLHERGKYFALCGLTSEVQAIFEIARLDGVFQIEASVDAFDGIKIVVADEMEVAAAISVREVTDELMAHFSRHPELLYAEHPKTFELVVGQILRGMGYTVEVVGGRGDRGRDLLATRDTPMGRLLLVVQCKRHSPKEPIKPDWVRAFMHVINDERATFGLFATTARFADGAFQIQKENEYRLRLADFERIKGWLADYGRWRTAGEANIWIPDVFA